MTWRIRRVNGLLREELSQLLRLQVKDPRLSGFITVTEVSISPDLRHARVFISVMGGEEEWRQTLEGLNAASGFLRRELAGRLPLRHIPDLSFFRDESIEHGAHLLELIDRVTKPGPEQDQA